MIYYYLPFALLFIGVFRKEINNYNLIAHIIFIYLFILIILRGNTSSDYETYQDRFISSSDPLNITENYDSFAVITSFFANFGLGNFRFLIFIFGLLNFIFLYVTIFINNKNVIFTLLYYYSYLFFVQPTSAIKASIAALLFLYAVQLYYNKRKYLHIFFLSIFFHPSALAGTLVFNYFFKKKYSISKLLIFVFLTFIFGQFFFSKVISYFANSDLGFLTLKSEGYFDSTQNQIGTRTANIFLIVVTLKLILNIFIRYFRNKLNYKNDKDLYFLNVHYFAIIIYYFCFSLPVIAARFYELIGIVEIIIITFPIKIFKEKHIVKLLIFFLIIFQFLVTIYLLGGEIVKPYKFYFQ